MGCSASAGPDERVNKSSIIRSIKEGQRENHQVGSYKEVDAPSKDPLPQSTRKFHEEYILGAKLGQGAFAQVRLATKVQLTEQVECKKHAPEAVKIVDLHRDVYQKDVKVGEVSRHTLKAALNEVTVWKKVGRHHNVIQLSNFFWDTRFCYFVMDKCDGTLLDALRKESELNEKTLGFFLFQMAKGIAYLHSVRVVHRDVKPDNFFFCGEGRHVKLGDFGLSKILPKLGGLSGIYGTAPYMCPEMLAQRIYDTKVDVWSLAVIVYVLFFGCFPYTPTESGSNAMKQAILKNSPEPSFKPHGRSSHIEYSKNVQDFIKTSLVREPSQRPTAVQLLLMPYMLQASGSPMALPWDEDMPSLRNMLRCARKAGAFETPVFTKADTVDPVLVAMQAKYHKGGIIRADSGPEGHLPENGGDDMAKGNPDAHHHRRRYSNGNGACGYRFGNPDFSETSSTRSSISGSTVQISSSTVQNTEDIVFKKNSITSNESKESEETMTVSV